MNSTIKLLVPWVAALIASMPGLVGLAQAQSPAQDYPNRPVRVLVGFPPGGSNDVLARIAAQALTEALKQPFVVENKPGGNTIIAGEAAARSAPDGYTLLVAASSSMTINPLIYKSLPYDPHTLVPITVLGSFPLALVTSAKQPYKSVRDLVSASTQAPSGLMYSSASLAHQIVTELFRSMSGGSFRNIPYKGSAQALNGVLAGDVQFAFLDLSPVIPHITSGSLRALGVSTAQRFDGLKGVPTLAETGVPGFDIKLWVGMFAPNGTPPEVTDKLYRVLSAYVRKPEIRERLTTLGIAAGGDTPAEVKTMMDRESKRFAEIVKEANITAD